MRSITSKIVAALALSVAAMAITSDGAFAASHRGPGAIRPIYHGGHYAGHRQWSGHGGYAVPLVAGAILGATVLGAYGYENGYYGNGDPACWQRRMTFDVYGNPMGRRVVNVCQ